MFSLGIDGGGSTLRIGIYGESLKCIHLHELLETSNPSVLGFSQAEELLKSNLSQALNNAGIASSTVRYVGAGMAGQRRESPTITPSFSGFIFLNPDSHLWKVSLKTEIDSPID